MLRWRRWLLGLIVIIVGYAAWWLAAPVAARFGIRPTITVSRETTFVEGPLREDGRVDFLAAVNARARRDITPENNAAVTFWHIMGPHPDASLEYFRALGAAPPSEQSGYFVELGILVERTATALRNAPFPEARPLADKLSESELLKRGLAAPWRSGEVLVLEDWLNVNRQPLKWLTEVVESKHFYSPVVASDRLLLTVERPEIIAKSAAKALVCRAMFSLGDRYFLDAQRDLLAAHRLARLISTDNSLVVCYAAHGIESLATHGDLVLATRDGLPATRALNYATQLRALPPLVSTLDAIDFGERLQSIDMAVFAAFDGVNPDDSPQPVLGVDWDHVLRTVNALFDREVEIAGIEDWRQQVAERRTFDDECQAFFYNLATWQSQVSSALRGPTAFRTNRALRLLLPVMRPALGPAAEMDRSNRQSRDLALAALALAAFHADHQRYPTTLSELVPMQLPEVLMDRFSGAELIYQPEGAGYRLYSVGPNLKDESGPQSDPENRHGDDLVVDSRK